MSEQKGFVFDETNPGVEFEHDDGWKVTLRVCTIDELDKIRKETTKKKTAFKVVERQAHRFAWDEVDEDKQSLMIWDYCIVDWQGITKKSGEVIPCTAENKLLLMRRSTEFAQFVTNSMKTLSKDEEDQKSESEKN